MVIITHNTVESSQIQCWKPRWMPIPFWKKARLKTELSLIYEHEDFKGCSGAPALFQVLMGNNLQDTFNKTVSLLKILNTPPMSTAESVRCFSTVVKSRFYWSHGNHQETRIHLLDFIFKEKLFCHDDCHDECHVECHGSRQKER